ncbi:hypothetical protein E2C01_101496 [Portunus trituberculatus]|uniref:Uncharacterized protein n=1 Tax=Portunus trituberculatus TaxID=210409 RepID=A0A5B7KFV3_PORTR|nr:hypothetical protein [Portunus trituberculatus]
MRARKAKAAATPEIRQAKHVPNNYRRTWPVSCGQQVPHPTSTPCVAGSAGDWRGRHHLGKVQPLEFT